MDKIRFSRVSYWLFACESQVVSQRVSGALRVLSFRVVSELILKLPNKASQTNGGYVLLLFSLCL